MDEYEASRLRIEKISTSVQCMKESLTCRICLELFNEPVTIKCGHKFCRGCIIKVTNNENSCCPFCSKKIHKRSIPKEGNKLLQASVHNFENLVKAIQIDSGIDVLQPQIKTKDTKESVYDYEKPSISKVQCTPSTSKGSSSTVNQSLIKPKVPNPVRSRLSLTKKKADVKSPSQGSQKNSLHKYLSNKSDPVPDQVIHSQEKVKSWLESCSTEEKDGDSVQQSNKLEGSLTTDQISTPPDQIYSSPQINEIKEAGVSPLPPSESGSESKFKETQLRIQEAEMMAKKKKMSLSLKDKSNVRTPNSIPATSHSDASDWRRIKQGGREMQVKTFKTLNVSIEKRSPSVALDDTVPYNSTNNDSKNISRDSEANNSSVDKTLQSRKRDSLKSENNNLLNKSSQIVIEDYKHRSMDSTGSPKLDIASYNVNASQLNDIIGVASSSSVPKTPEKIRSSTNLRSKSNFSSNLDQLSPQKSKSSSGQESSDNELSNCNNKATTVNNLQNSSPKKSKLSLKKSRGSTNWKDSSPPGTPEKINENAKETLYNFSPERPKSGLLREPLQNRTNRALQKLTPTNSPLADNLANKRSSSVTNGCRISFTKLGKICKPKRKVPFLYLGKLDKEKCIYISSTSHKKPMKPMPVIKSSVPVHIDYNSGIDDRNNADLEKFLPDKSHSKVVSQNRNAQLRSPISYSPVNNHEEPMNIDEDFDFHRQDQSHQQMEIDVTLPPAKMIVKNHSDLEKEDSGCEKTVVEKKDPSLKSSKGMRKTLKNKELEEISPQIDENVPEPSTSTCRNKSKKSETEIKKYNQIPESSSKVNTSTKSLKSAQSKVLTEKRSQKKVKIDKIPDDLISISSDDSAVSASRKKNVGKIDRTKCNEPSFKKGPKIDKKSYKESCTESEVSIISGKRGGENVEDAEQRYSSTSSSSLRIVKKKRTHSESSNDDDDVHNILDKWMNTDKDQVTKKPKISLDSEEITHVTKRRVRSKYSINSSSDDEEETFKENKQPSWSLFEDKEPEVKNPVTEANINKLSAMPSSMLSADLFESNEPSAQPTAQVPNRQNRELTDMHASPFDSDAHSDKENMSEKSQDNVTVVDAKQVKKRKSIFSTTTTDSEDKESTEFKQTPEREKSVKMTEEQTDEIESSQKDKNKTVDNFEHESDPNFGRESLFNVTQERLAYKNIEKQLFGHDLSKIPENQIEETPNIDKFSTPHRKPKSSEENDDFDSDNIAPTPVSKRRHAIRFPSSQSSSGNTEGNASAMFSPGKKTNLIPAITPMKNTKSYPLCHSTPMISSDNSPNLIHSQIGRIKMVGSSLNVENTKLVQQFVNRFDAHYLANFDEDVTHVVVKVDPETKAAPKTFKYIQGIAFKKHVVSFQWIRDCLAGNELVDADDEKYDVLDPDTLQSGSKKSRLSSEKLFENFAFCCLEPFQKVSVGEFKELLSYNGAAVVDSIPEFHLHNDKLKVIIVGSDELDEESILELNRVEATAVHFEWVVDSLSQFQVLAVPSYLCETTTDKAMRLGFPPELLVEEETLEEEEEDELIFACRTRAVH